MAEGKPRYTPYKQPAGGWGAAAATAKVLLEQSVVTKGSRALLSWRDVVNVEPQPLALLVVELLRLAVEPSTSA